MSEIRSISEGTFVIGDTNGLTFEAGPGISVSQPSEGTVRIANDETVLWESQNGFSSNITSIDLSESYSNFDIIAVYWCHNGVDNEIQYYKTKSSTNERWVHFGGREAGNGNVYFFTAIWKQTSATNFTKDVCFYRLIGPSQCSNGSATNELVPIKIVGINRISGSNA